MSLIPRAKNGINMTKIGNLYLAFGKTTISGKEYAIRIAIMYLEFPDLLVFIMSPLMLRGNRHQKPRNGILKKGTKLLMKPI